MLFGVSGLLLLLLLPGPGHLDSPRPDPCRQTSAGVWETVTHFFGVIILLPTVSSLFYHYYSQPDRCFLECASCIGRDGDADIGLKTPRLSPARALPSVHHSETPPVVPIPPFHPASTNRPTVVAAATATASVIRHQ